MGLKKVGKWIWIFTAIVALAIAGFAFWRYNSAKEAAITLESPKTIIIGQEIGIPVTINTAGATINAAEVYLKFDPAIVEVLSPSKDNSIFTLWISGEPKFSNQSGEVSFAGGLPNPGFSGIGQIGAVKIRAKKTGDAVIEFDPKSRALANDGVGSEIKLKLDAIKIKVGE